MSDKDDEEDRRPKQLKSIPTDSNYKKPDNNRKSNSKNKDNNIRNNSNNIINIYDDDEEPTPEPEPSHHGDPRHHAFHSCKFINDLKN